MVRLETDYTDQRVSLQAGLVTLVKIKYLTILSTVGERGFWWCRMTIEDEALREMSLLGFLYTMVRPPRITAMYSQEDQAARGRCDHAGL